jgi:hypothetical protein
VEFRLFKRINFNNFSKGIISLFVLLFLFSVADAQTEPPQFMTVDGRLYDSSNTTNPLLDASVLLKIQVLNPAKTCILYEEEQTVSTLSSNGYFNVRVGSPTSDPKRSTDDSNNSMMQVFQNQNASIAGRNSSGSGVPCSYTPANGDSRFFRFIVTPSSTGVTSQLSPDMTIDSVPQALVAESLQGLSPDSFIRVNANTTQAKADNIFGAGYAALTNLISGTSSLYLQNTVNGTVIPNRATDPGSPTAGQIWYDSVANALKYYNGSTVQTLSTGVATDPSKLPLTGGAMTGNISMGGNQILGVGHITQNPQSTITLGTYTTAQQGTLTAALTAANKGATWFNSDTNKMMYWDGTVAQVVLDVSTAGTVGDITAVTAGTGLTGGGVTGAVTLNVDIGTGATQLFTNNAVDSCPAGQMLQMSPGPIYDWSCIAINDSSKLPIAGGTMTGSLNIDNEQELRLSEADVNGSNYVALKAPATVATNYTLTLPGTAGTNGQVLSTNGSGVLSWVTPSTGSGDFLANGSVAMTGQLRAISGTSSAPGITFDSDLDTGLFNLSGTIQFTLDGNNMMGMSSNDFYGTRSRTAYFNLLDNPSESSPAYAFRNDSNTGMFNPMDENIAFAINGTERIRFDANGNVGIGTSAPTQKLDVEGTILSGPKGTAAGDGGAIRLEELATNGANTVGFRAPDAITSDILWQLPGVDGTSGQLLQTNGAGVLSWTSAPAPTANSLNFSHFLDAMTLDASTNIEADNSEVLSITNIGTGDSFRVNDAPGDTSPFVIDQNGNVGIGTTAVDLQTGVHIQNNETRTLYVERISVDNAPTNVRLNKRRAGSPPVVDTEFAQLSFGYDDTGSVARIAAKIAAGVDGTVGNADVPGRLSFYTVPDGSSTELERIRITNAGNVGIGTTSPAAKLDVEGTVQIGDSGETCAAPANAGMVRYSAGAVQYCNGSAWQTLGVSGAGLTTFNTQTGNTQTLAIGSTGLAPNWNSASDVHTLHIPLASGAGVTSGTISKTDYDAFNTKVASTRAVNTAAGSGLTGGGDLSVDRNLAVNITGTTAETVVAGGDEILIWDLSAGALRKMTRANFVLSETEVDAMVSNNGYLSSEVDTLATVTGRGASTGTSITMNAQAQVRYADGDSSNFVAIQSPATVTADYTLTLPDTAGANGQVLSTNGVGVLSWITPSSVPANNSLNFSHFLDAMTLDATTDIAVGTNVLSITNDGAGNSLVVNDNSGADATPFVIDATGSVGIGTSSPMWGLTVVNSGGADIKDDINIVTYGTATTPSFLSSRARGTAASPTAVQTNDVLLSAFGWGYTGSAFAAGANLSILADNTWTTSAATQNSSIAFYSRTAGAQAERMRISSNGNVGIGTTTPGANLDLRSSAGTWLRLRAADVAHGMTSAAGTTDTSLAMGGFSGIGGGWLSGYSDSDWSGLTLTGLIGTATPSTSTPAMDLRVGKANGTFSQALGTNELALRVLNGSTALMSVLGGGNVGIGVSVPTQRLEVDGTILSGPKGAVAGDGGAIRLEELAVNGANTVGFRAPDAITSDILWQLPGLDGTSGQLLQTNGAGVLSWASAPAPAANSLDFSHFNDNMNLDLSTNITADNAEVLSITNIGTGNSFVVNDQSGDTTPFVIDASGNVGIGTTAPGFTLDINGGGLGITDNSGSFTSGLNLINTSSGVTGPATKIDFQTGSTTKARIIGGADGASNLGYLSFSTRSTTPSTNLYERMRIDQAGNVGIGTSAPTVNLEVTGGTVKMGVDNLQNGVVLLSSANTINNGRIRMMTGHMEIAAGNNQDLKLMSGNSSVQALTISGNSGNVGIGTTAPATLLHVNGAISLQSSLEGISTPTNTGVSYAIPDTSLNVRRLTLTGNTTITLPTFSPTAVNVYSLTLFIKQDATGGRSVTWAASGADVIKWDAGSAPVISTSPNFTSIIQFTKASDEAVWYGSMTWREN